MTTLRPGESVQLPFEIWVGTNANLRVDAHYDAGMRNDAGFDKRKICRGSIEVRPLTLRFEK